MLYHSTKLGATIETADTLFLWSHVIFVHKKEMLHTGPQSSFVSIWFPDTETSKVIAMIVHLKRHSTT